MPSPLILVFAVLVTGTGNSTYFTRTNSISFFAISWTATICASAPAVVASVHSVFDLEPHKFIGSPFRVIAVIIGPSLVFLISLTKIIPVTPFGNDFSSAARSLGSGSLSGILLTFTKSSGASSWLTNKKEQPTAASNSTATPDPMATLRFMGISINLTHCFSSFDIILRDVFCSCIAVPSKKPD